ncbi:hypothetical protein [Sinosporangium siamense]|uniref:Uncharacterized protein n=1 Tax=Sinosporangium siamense TaxID=1367973 RepID=A0A919RH25_9ACTN|nr:hypothetical protein [Sinosporangium siamense]GII92660.1 hypothetical protein Ssi02_28910 [Sinosporangium siamense]
MPPTVAVAATLQLLLAATFFVIPITVWFTGAAAQHAAEAEVARQGHPPEILARHGVAFRENTWQLLLALFIGLVMTVPAALNLAGDGTGRVMSWIIQPIVFVVVGLVTSGQVFATRATRAAFRKSDDPAARTLDTDAMLTAAMTAFPSWLRPLILLRFSLATLGSLIVIVLLTLPASGTHFL